MPIHNFGSVCSGIEAASFTLTPLGVNPLWLSEIAEYPKRFLELQYPNPDSGLIGRRNPLSSLFSCWMAEWGQ